MMTPYEHAQRYAQRSQLKWLLWRIPVLIMLAIITGVMLATTGCTIIRSGESTAGKRWVWIVGLPSLVEIEGITVDNRINLLEGLNVTQ